MMGGVHQTCFETCLTESTCSALYRSALHVLTVGIPIELEYEQPCTRRNS
jgi:hypothetical protein